MEAPRHLASEQNTMAIIANILTTYDHHMLSQHDTHHRQWDSEIARNTIVFGPKRPSHHYLGICSANKKLQY